MIDDVDDDGSADRAYDAICITSCLRDVSGPGTCLVDGRTR